MTAMRHPQKLQNDARVFPEFIATIIARVQLRTPSAQSEGVHSSQLSAPRSRVTQGEPVLVTSASALPVYLSNRALAWFRAPWYPRNHTLQAPRKLDANSGQWKRSRSGLKLPETLPRGKRYDIRHSFIPTSDQNSDEMAGVLAATLDYEEIFIKAET